MVRVSPLRGVILLFLVTSLALQLRQWYGAAGVKRHEAQYAVSAEQAARCG